MLLPEEQDDQNSIVEVLDTIQGFVNRPKKVNSGGIFKGTPQFVKSETDSKGKKGPSIIQTSEINNGALETERLLLIK